MPASGVKKPTIMSNMFSEEEEDDEDGEDGDGREEGEPPLCCGSVAESLWFRRFRNESMCLFWTLLNFAGFQKVQSRQT